MGQEQGHVRCWFPIGLLVYVVVSTPVYANMLATARPSPHAPRVFSLTTLSKIYILFLTKVALYNTRSINQR